MRGSSCQKYKQKQVANKAVVLCCVSVVTIILTFYMKPTYVFLHVLSNFSLITH